MKAIKIVLVLALMGFVIERATAQQKEQVIRLAKLIIDSAYLEDYKVFLQEGIETSLREEPGVITLYALSEKENPTHFTILETYSNTEAYQGHIKTPHFLKYKQGTMHMIKSLELIDVAPMLPELKISQVKKRNKKSTP